MLRRTVVRQPITQRGQAPFGESARSRLFCTSGGCRMLGCRGAHIGKIASRLAALARTGEVLTSRTVKDLVAGSGISFTDRGTHQLPDIPPPGTAGRGFCCRTHAHRQRRRHAHAQSRGTVLP